MNSAVTFLPTTFSYDLAFTAPSRIPTTYLETGMLWSAAAVSIRRFKVALRLTINRVRARELLSALAAAAFLRLAAITLE